MKINKPIIMAAHARTTDSRTTVQFTSSANLNIPVWIKTIKPKK